jgi:hypothetical protein
MANKAKTKSDVADLLTPKEISEFLWQNPRTPEPVQAELRPVDPFDLDLIPEPFRDWVSDIAHRMGCPVDFVAIGAIVVASSVISAGAGIHPKRKDDWLCVPNLWAAVIGPPSTLKSPALSEVMKPLVRLEMKASEEFEEADLSYKAELEMYKVRVESMKKEMKATIENKTLSDDQRTKLLDDTKKELAKLKEPPPATYKRYLTNDSTIEKIVEILRDNTRGILLYRDELIGLLASWDREGRETDRAFFLEAWKGDGSYKMDRISRGTIHAKHLSISILGGIQPPKLISYLYAAIKGNDNDGLPQRLQLAVYPDTKYRPVVDEYPNKEARTRAHDVIRTLASADFFSWSGIVPADEEEEFIPAFRFDPEAQDYFDEWLRDLTKDLFIEDEEPIITEHLGKFRSLMPSLALIFHLIDMAADSIGNVESRVSKEAVLRAGAWCQFLGKHIRRIYGLVLDVRLQAATRLSKKIKSGALPNPFTERDVYRKHWMMLDNKDIVEAACDELISLGWLREYQPIALIGRPRASLYFINPVIRPEVTV